MGGLAGVFALSRNEFAGSFDADGTINAIPSTLAPKHPEHQQYGPSEADRNSDLIFQLASAPARGGFPVP